MSYPKSQAAATNLLGTIGQLNSIAGTIEVKFNGTPASTADSDAEYVGIINGYNSQVQRLYDELNRLYINLGTGDRKSVV